MIANTNEQIMATLSGMAIEYGVAEVEKCMIAFIERQKELEAWIAPEPVANRYFMVLAGRVVNCYGGQVTDKRICVVLARTEGSNQTKTIFHERAYSRALKNSQSIWYTDDYCAADEEVVETDCDDVIQNIRQHWHTHYKHNATEILDISVEGEEDHYQIRSELEVYNVYA